MKFFTSHHRYILQAALAVVFAVVLVAWLAGQERVDFSAGDSGAYMSVAKGLVDSGVYTDGHFTRSAAVTGEDGQGMFFAPLYPALLAGVMAVDNVLYGSVECFMAGGDRADCAQDLGLLAVVYIGLAALAAFAVWLSGWVLTGRYTVAWLAMVLALAAEAYTYYTAQIMTELLLFPLFTLACLCAAHGYKRKTLWGWFLAGAFLALAALTRPAFVYLFYASIPAIAVMTWHQVKGLRALRVPLLFVLGFAVLAGPWIVRNGLAMGEYSISKGYASFILVQRVAYNDMGWDEFGASFVYGLPDFGDSLAKDMFEPELYERFDYMNPEGFYLIGNGRLRAETIEAAGGVDQHLSYLMKHEVLGNAFKHTVVTLSLAWRGMWVSKYWGLISIPIFLGVFVYAWRRRWGEFLIFSIPPWFMLGFHAFTSVNVVRYNLILIPALSVGAAFAIVCLVDFIIRKKRAA